MSEWAVSAQRIEKVKLDTGQASKRNPNIDAASRKVTIMGWGARIRLKPSRPSSCAGIFDLLQLRREIHQGLNVIEI
jgi:hypothetical protein